MEDILRMFRGFDLLGPTPVSIVREVCPLPLLLSPTTLHNPHKFPPVLSSTATRFQFHEPSSFLLPGHSQGASPALQSSRLFCMQTLPWCSSTVRQVPPSCCGRRGGEEGAGGTGRAHGEGEGTGQAAAAPDAEAGAPLGRDSLQQHRGGTSRCSHQEQRLSP